MLGQFKERWQVALGEKFRLSATAQEAKNDPSFICPHYALD